LLKIAADRPPTSPSEASSNTSIGTTISVDDVDFFERPAREGLIQAGGRPAYPIHLMEDIVNNPEAHLDIVMPWARPAPRGAMIEKCVALRQLGDWKCFRVWQTATRHNGSTIDEHSGLRKHFDRRSAFNYFLRAFQPRSTTYTAAAKKLLELYDFTRPFQFHEDPKQQDKLTTWIEYICYISAMHYHFSELVKYKQKMCDEVWKILADSDLMKPDETRESILTTDVAWTRHQELKQASEAVRSAESVLVSVEKAQDSTTNSRDELTAKITIDQARANLDSAKQLEASLKRWQDLLRQYFGILHRTHLLEIVEEEKVMKLRQQWALEQVPLIEAEMDEASVSIASPNGARSTKRKRDGDDPIEGQPRSKLPRSCKQGLVSLDGAGVRQSTRIAARQRVLDQNSNSANAKMSDGSTKGLAPTSTESRRKGSNVPEKEIVKGKQSAKRSGRRNTKNDAQETSRKRRRNRPKDR
jgi:hypothetical protein